MASFLLLIVKTDANSILYYFIIFVLYYLLMDAYIGSSRQLKRYHMTTKSPIFAHLSETLNGLTTIRAYGKAAEFQKETRYKIDINNRAFWSVSCPSPLIPSQEVKLNFFFIPSGTISREIDGLTSIYRFWLVWCF